VSVTIITTTGNTYSIPRGTGWRDMILNTGELSVTVYDRNPDVPEGSPPAAELASFGSVEVVYRDSEVTVVTAPATRSGL
jgi:hypothetical protein